MGWSWQQGGGGEALEISEPFQYSRRIMTSTEYDWLYVQGNIQKAQKIWTRILWVLIKKETTIRISVKYHKVVVHSMKTRYGWLWGGGEKLRRGIIGA